MKVEATKCDVCGKVKGEANKWLVVFVSKLPNPPWIYIQAKRANSFSHDYEDICSDACLQKRLGLVLDLIRNESQESYSESKAQLDISHKPFGWCPTESAIAQTPQSTTLKQPKMDSFDNPNGEPIPRVTPDMPRELLTAEHATEHYRITEWVKPTAESPYHKFFTEGPGLGSKCYIALGESCGPHLIQSLEAAWKAGCEWHRNAAFANLHKEGNPL